MHDQRLTALDLRLSGVLGLADRWGAALSLPLRGVNTSIVYRDKASGQPITLAYADIHHRDETLVGLGDFWLTAERALTLGDWGMGMRLGTSLPMGRIQPDPFAAGRRGEAHQHIQFGSGTFDPLLGADLRWQPGDWGVSGWALAQLPLYANRHGHQAGARFAGGLAAVSTLGLEHWRFRAGLEATGELAERWRDSPFDADGMEMEGNRGRLDVLLAATVTWTVGGVPLWLGVKAPLLTRVVGAQVSYPLLVDLGVETRFALW